MRVRQLLRMSLMAAAIMGSAAAAQAQGAAESGTLKVTVEYKGTSGTVDAEHKIWVWVFDTPDISADSMPLAVGSLKENKGSYTFVGLPKQVYLAATFDTGGGYDGSAAPPPSGSPIVIHGATGPGTPAAAVDTGGDEAAVTVTFDDTIRMP